MTEPDTPLRSTEADLLDLLDRALRSAPGDEAELALALTSRNTTRFAASSIHQNSTSESTSVAARVVDAGRIGAATGNGLEPDRLAALLATAHRLARSSPPLARFRGLPGPGPTVDPIPPDDATIGLRVGEKGERLARVFDQARRVGAELHGSFTTLVERRAVGNGRGIRVAQTSTAADAVVIAIRDGSSGFATEASRSAAALPIERLADEAIEKARLAAGEPRDLPPGSYDVLLEPAAISELLEWFAYIGFSARTFEDGSSFVAGREGERITGERFTLVDDGTDPSGLPNRFDAEGVPKRRTELIANGVARGTTLDKATADRLGREATGHALGPGSEDGSLPTNLFVLAGTESRAELLSGIERGLWITRFHYVNGLLDPKRALMTGMTRDGTFWIENGRVVAPTVNLRWTESILEAFARIDGATSERRAIPAWSGGGVATVAPAIRIRGFTFTGASKR